MQDFNTVEFSELKSVLLILIYRDALCHKTIANHFILAHLCCIKMRTHQIPCTLLTGNICVICLLPYIFHMRQMQNTVTKGSVM